MEILHPKLPPKRSSRCSRRRPNMSLTDWDYTELADTYSRRPPYSGIAAQRVLSALPTNRRRVADIGAGTGHLAVELSARGCLVDAIEPNDAMRRIGMSRTKSDHNIRWAVGTGEDTKLQEDSYDFVTYGSSFNTMEAQVALVEASRILKHDGVLACMWNHRELDDPLQSDIEAVIRRHVATYTYGSRRQDQASVIEEGGLFGPAARFEERVLHTLPTEQWIAAWRSHATLQRQAGDRFEDVIREIAQLVAVKCGSSIEVPYVTVGWIAPRTVSAPRS
jgi:ubiquinone/menaquinone biosynthesis C-methylase UbiE